MVRAEKNSALIGQFFYDADGKQVKTIVNGVDTFYVGNHYEVKNSVVTKYYFAGTTRLAVRTNGMLKYLLADHLGSTTLSTDANGTVSAAALYKAFGELRSTPSALGTDYKFTGQREEASLGLYFFVARWFDPSLGRFTSPDTIVPTSTQGTQAWDRYAFVNNNPVRYTDPTGNTACSPDERDEGGCFTLNPERVAGLMLLILLSSIEAESMDPFEGTYESREGYLEHQDDYDFLKEFYVDNDIDLNQVVSNGLESPLNFESTDNNPGVYMYLQARSDFKPYQIFVELMGLDVQNVYNYEPHYLNGLMMHNRDILAFAIYDYYVWLEEHGFEDTDEYEEYYRWINDELEEGLSE